MSAQTLPDFVNEYEQATSYDHYPTLTELLRQGGQPGLEYCGVYGSNLRLFARYGWRRVERLLEFGVTGPKGTADTVVLLYRGDPIPGAAMGNGRRMIYYDITIEDLTGISIDGKMRIEPAPVSQAAVDKAGNQLSKRKEEPVHA